jgi:hypothetical protein
MKTSASFNEMLQLGLNPCSWGAELFISNCENYFGSRWSQDLQLDFNFALELSKNDPIITRWLKRNKPTLLGYTDKKIQGYVFNNFFYNDLDSAKKAKSNYIIQRTTNHLKLNSCALYEITDTGIVLHKIQDIENFSVPDNITNYHFKVFNHRTGTHQIFDTLDEAKTYRSTISENFTQEDINLLPISVRYIYNEDGISIEQQIVDESTQT